MGWTLHGWDCTTNLSMTSCLIQVVLWFCNGIFHPQALSSLLQRPAPCCMKFSFRPQIWWLYFTTSLPSSSSLLISSPPLSFRPLLFSLLFLTLHLLSSSPPRQNVPILDLTQSMMSGYTITQWATMAQGSQGILTEKGANMCSMEE